MPRDNKTEYALLGLLTLRPMTGYDMRRTIGQSIGFFWQESYGQIYPTLNRLHKKQLATRRVRRQKGKPERIEYRITTRGRKHFLAWLEREPEQQPVRHELLLKLFFGSAGQRKNQIDQMKKYRDRQREDLATYEVIEAEHFTGYRGDPNLPWWKMTLSYGRHLAEARLAWAEDTIATLSKLPGKKIKKPQSERAK